MILDLMQAITLMQGTTQAAGQTKAGSTSYIVLMVVLVAVMYFMMIRPQKKRQKEEQEMRSSLEIGDEIITIGGIVGKVVTIREEDIIIETGADRNKMKITRWAIQTNNTAAEKAKAEREAIKAAAEKEKTQKKKSKKED